MIGLGVIVTSTLKEDFLSFQGSQTRPWWNAGSQTEESGEISQQAHQAVPCEFILPSPSAPSLKWVCTSLCTRLHYLIFICVCVCVCIQICSQKGFFCEQCHENEILYPFDGNIYQVREEKDHLCCLASSWFCTIMLVFPSAKNAEQFSTVDVNQRWWTNVRSVSG